jgi:hypothetical protein
MVINEVAPALIDAGAKAFATVGEEGVTVSVALAAEPVLKLVEVTAPVLFT